MPPGSRQLRHNFWDRYYGKWNARANLPFNGAAVRNRSQNFLANIILMESCGLLAARYAFSAKSVVPELILFDRRVPVDIHGAGGGRNWADPITRHRNAGCCSERVAHSLSGLHEPLWVWLSR